MKKLTIIRHAYLPDVTAGFLYLANQKRLAVIERPWIDNQPSISCIPCGAYVCKPRYYNKGKYDAIEICNVPGRTYILFHRGNFVRNSEGCVLVNSTLGVKGGQVRGFDSADAFQMFMEHHGDCESILTIKNYEGGVL